METTGEARERLQAGTEEDRDHIDQDEDGEGDYDADMAAIREQHRSGKDPFLERLAFCRETRCCSCNRTNHKIRTGHKASTKR